MTTPINASSIARHWQLRTRTIRFDSGPAIMGIVNVTPDSFSDGGRFYTPNLAIEHALQLEDSGATILDIGGESTRPYSQPVSQDEELRRVIPVLEGLTERVSAAISIDTSKAKVAGAAIDLGAEIVNDITGLMADPEMPSLVARAGVGVCAMHIQGTPQTMQDNPTYQNVVSEIFDHLADRDQALQAVGVSPDRICLDPGIGFGKTYEHNLSLLRSAERFLELGRPILIGHSRKGFVGKLIGGKDRDRDAGSLGISLAMAAKGIQVIRVHQVGATVDALNGFLHCFR
jgi:dihydropteroate synthase